MGSGIRVRPGHARRDEKSAAAGTLLAEQLKTGGGVFRALDDDMLQQVAEARLDRPLVTRLTSR